MRNLLIIAILLITSPAFAISEAALIRCADTKDPAWCLRSLQEEEKLQLFREERQRQELAHQRQMDIAQEQSRGMALFGAGNAMINGMNQHLNNMQLPITPMPQVQPMPMPFPNAGR